MIDHLGFSVSDIQLSKEFYAKALAPIGYQVVMDFGEAVGLGAGGKPDLWLSKGTGTNPPLHIAFVAETRAQVDAFYDAAIAAGGKDNGKPGLRPQYHPNYYGAFVIDRDGNNVEVVKHRPE